MGLLDWLPGIGKLLDTGVNIFNSRANRNMQDYMARNSISLRVADAKRAGIHPLAALGAQTFNPAPIGINTDLAGMGQSFASAGRANSTHERNMRRLDEELMNEKIKHLKAQTSAITSSVYGSSGLPFTSGSAPVSGIVGQDSPRLESPPGVAFQQSQIPVSQSMGAQAGLLPFDLYGVNSAGTIYKVPTQMLQEGISEGSFFTQTKYNLGQFVDYVKGYQAYLFPTVMQDMRQRLQAERNGIMMYVKPGYEARFNVIRGSWVIRPIGKEGSQFWDNKKLRNIGKRIRIPKNKVPKGESVLWDY